MNLRTHTFAIPALCGLASFAVLVSSDYGLRRLTHGPGYGFAAYVTDVNSQPFRRSGRLVAALVPGAGEVSVAELPTVVVPAPAPAPVPAAPAVVAEAPQDPVGAPDEISAPPEAAAAVAETTPDPAPSAGTLPMVAPDADPVIKASAEDSERPVTCSLEQGFKRCRVGD